MRTFYKHSPEAELKFKNGLHNGGVSSVTHETTIKHTVSMNSNGQGDPSSLEQQMLQYQQLQSQLMMQQQQQQQMYQYANPWQQQMVPNQMMPQMQPQIQPRMMQAPIYQNYRLNGML